MILSVLRNYVILSFFCFKSKSSSVFWYPYIGKVSYGLVDCFKVGTLKAQIANLFGETINSKKVSSIDIQNWSQKNVRTCLKINDL